MTTPSIEKQVRSAYAQLRKENKNPTVRAIHELIGSGSFATLAPIVKKIKEEESHDPYSIADLPISNHLKTRWVSLLKDTVRELEGITPPKNALRES